MDEPLKCMAVVRIRGMTGVRYDIEDTLRMISLTRNYHATLIDNRPSYLGMLQKMQNEATWGEVSKETISLLLKERGRSVGNHKLTDDFARKAGYDSVDKLAEAIYNLEVELKDIPDIKPLFRLHPPRKGFKGKIKISYRSGGETGYRGQAINTIIRKMM